MILGVPALSHRQMQSWSSAFEFWRRSRKEHVYHVVPADKWKKVKAGALTPWWQVKRFLVSWLCLPAPGCGETDLKTSQDRLRECFAQWLLKKRKSDEKTSEIHQSLEQFTKKGILAFLHAQAKMDGLKVMSLSFCKGRKGKKSQKEKEEDER